MDFPLALLVRNGGGEQFTSAYLLLLPLTFKRTRGGDEPYGEMLV